MVKKVILSAVCILLVASCAFCAEEKWKERKSTHFVVYYKDAPKDFIEDVIDAAEDYYYEITKNLGFHRKDFWLWEERADIYIYLDADDYSSSTGQPTWSSGSASYRERKISTYPLASGFFDTLLPHELGHIIFREFVGFRAKIPLWLDEGVATYQEKAKRWGARKTVKKAIDAGTFIPMEELSKMGSASRLDPTQVNLFYAEATSIVYFLLTQHGRHNFIEFCRELRDGETMEDAIDHAYVRFESMDDLNTHWLRYIKND
ncbi:peptidase MA family metallohydrolase [Candidatus Omnitrophota bacterium]